MYCLFKWILRTELPDFDAQLLSNSSEIVFLLNWRTVHCSVLTDIKKNNSSTELDPHIIWYPNYLHVAVLYPTYLRNKDPSQHYEKKHTKNIRH